MSFVLPPAPEPVLTPRTVPPPYPASLTLLGHPQLVCSHPVSLCHQLEVCSTTRGKEAHGREGSSWGIHRIGCGNHAQNALQLWDIGERSWECQKRCIAIAVAGNDLSTPVRAGSGPVEGFERVYARGGKLLPCPPPCLNKSVRKEEGGALALLITLPVVSVSLNLITILCFHLLLGYRCGASDLPH